MLTRDEVRSVLASMVGVPRLVISLLHGTEMRLLEGLRVRVKDIDFVTRIVVVREGKGDKDRRTMLPRPLIEPLHEHLDMVRQVHEKDRLAGFGEVWLPHALERKYPHHLDESTIQKAVKEAVRRAKVTKRAAIPSATRSRRICSKTATTSGRFRNCSVTPTCRPR